MLESPLDAAGRLNHLQSRLILVRPEALDGDVIPNPIRGAEAAAQWAREQELAARAPTPVVMSLIKPPAGAVEGSVYSLSASWTGNFKPRG